jgi:Secretion system C-terminal sorting domain
MKKRVALVSVGCFALLAVGIYALLSVQQTTPTTEQNTKDLPQTTSAIAAESNLTETTRSNTPLSKTPVWEAPTQRDITQNIAEKLAAIEAENGEKNDGAEEEDNLNLPKGIKKMSKPMRFKEAMEHEINMTKDPRTGVVANYLFDALEATKRRQIEVMRQGDFLRGSPTKARWNERGPDNVGGRSRTILVDLNDPTGKTVFVGCATGGLFKNTNIQDPNSPWARVDDWVANLTTSSIAQDPKAKQIMYVGLGDSDANDARGSGVMKSIDGGKTWNYLNSTANFGVVPVLIVTPDSSNVYAATATGIKMSRDKGNTWMDCLSSANGANISRFYGLQRGSDGRFYASNNGNIYRSDKAGYPSTWVQMTRTGTGFPANSWSRTEIAVAPSDPNIIYAVGSISGAGTDMYRSIDGGTSWVRRIGPAWADGCGANGVVGDWTRGQAWYDLTILVDQQNPNIVWIGGIDLFRTTDAGVTWRQASRWQRCPNRIYTHADQHILVQDPFNPTTVYAGNDGGIFRITNSNDAFAITEHIKNYVSALFYGAAIHPDSSSNYFIAGAQDNGTNVVQGSTRVGTAQEVIGGDGFMCFIDQNEPNIQIGSLYGGLWHVTQTGSGFSLAGNSNGGFYCPADYDSKNNILYAQTQSGDLWRMPISTKQGQVFDIAGFTLGTAVSRIFVDENVNNRIYVGTNNGRVLQIDSAHTGATVSKVRQIGSFSGFISSIDVERGKADHILVTVSSVGSNITNVYESRDGGTTWVSCDGPTLPEMAVRWGIFNPNTGNSALIATDLGVWSTDLLNGAQTQWTPPIPGKGTPLVRTDQLTWRKSDKTVLASTYGRALWTTKSMGKEVAVMDYQPVAYLNVPVVFNAELSSGADSYLWNFTTRTDSNEIANNSYSAIGRYDMSLAINGNNATTQRGKIQILPSLPTPYKASTAGYAGNGENANSTVHFGLHSPSGSAFTTGNSPIVGKAGTHAGQNAFVLGVNEQFYQRNTLAYLYTPNFDLTQKGIYQLSFWAQFDFQTGYDGMQVEYSLDKGLTWKQLGTNNDPDWFNYRNTSVQGGSFPIGQSFFSGSTTDWTRYKFNLSDFSGNANVAFRFTVKTDSDLTQYAGIAIDDIIVSKYEGKLETAIVQQSGAYTRDGASIDVRFQSQPEYFAKTFELEMSVNARTWSKVADFKATGVTSEDLQDYTTQIKGTPLDLYYFRVKSINNDAASNYKLDFYSTPFIIRRNKDAPLTVNKVFPSPFNNTIGVTFTDVVDKDVVLTLYDDIGRLVGTVKNKPNGVYQELTIRGLAKGIYLLTVQIGDAKPETYKLFGGE